MLLGILTKLIKLPTPNKSLGFSSSYTPNTPPRFDPFDGAPIPDMSTLNNLLDSASVEDEAPPTGSSQPSSEWVSKEDPASGIPRMVNEVTGEVKVEIDDGDGNVVQSKLTSQGPNRTLMGKSSNNQQPSPTKVRRAQIK